MKARESANPHDVCRVTNEQSKPIVNSVEATRGLRSRATYVYRLLAVCLAVSIHM